MTEYTLSAETSVPVALTGAELIGVTQAGKYYSAKVSDVMAAAVTLSGVTIDNPTLSGSTTINAPVIFSCLATQSILIGTTVTARLGFYGTAGTSQPSNAAQAQYTNTVNNPTTCTGVIGFSTTQAMIDALSLIMQMRSTLVSAGLMKGS